MSINLKGSNKPPHQLDDSNGLGKVDPRDFFWDKLTLFVTSAIIGLAAIDVITEYIRGGDIACFSPLGMELSEAHGAFINGFCAQYLPLGSYIPAFSTIHAIIITVPHYLWLNHYGGNFEYFFEHSSSLKRLREEGKHIEENLVIVCQLEDAFSVYGRSTIFSLYKLKLIAQLVWSLAGIVFISLFFFQEFHPNFMCPTSSNNLTDLPHWPLETKVVCVFQALELLHALWYAQIGLLGLVCFSLFWALIWCYSTHSSELGAKVVAQFSFKSGLAPACYIPSILPLLSMSGFRIQTDFDFLLMKVFRADYGLGHVFREVQIEKELQVFTEDDQRRLDNHLDTQTTFIADNVNPSVWTNEQELDEQDLKWKFSKVSGEIGVYREFETIPRSHRLLLTDTMRGAVLAFGQRAPHNKNAISVSFGDVGYALALARVFDRVATLNFSPTYISADEIVSVAEYRTFMASLVFSENVFSKPTSDVLQFVENLRTIWVSPDSDAEFSETSFIVIGPIPKQKDFNSTNLHLLFIEIFGCLTKGALLLTLHPLEISGKKVMQEFVSYEPLEPHFLPLRQEPPIFPEDRSQPAEWPARSSILKAARARTMPGPPVNVDSLPYQFPLTVHCGKTELKVLFSTYYYTNAEEIPRPQKFNP